MVAATRWDSAMLPWLHMLYCWCQPHRHGIARIAVLVVSLHVFRCMCLTFLEIMFCFVIIVYWWLCFPAFTSFCLLAAKVQNHDHACTTSCGRSKPQTNVKAETDSKKKGKGTCRFGFDHIIDMCVQGRKRRIRRQGKKLIEEPFVSTNLDPKEYGKVFLKRTHPFRSSSSDVAQVTGRSNIDLQWTTRLPILSDAVESEDVPIDRAASSHLASLFWWKEVPAYPNQSKHFCAQLRQLFGQRIAQTTT